MSDINIPWQKPFPFLWIYRAGPDDTDVIAYFPLRGSWVHNERKFLGDIDSKAVAAYIQSEYGEIKKESYQPSSEPEFVPTGYRPPSFPPARFSIIPKEARDFLNKKAWWSFQGIGSQVEIYIVHEGIESHLVAEEVIRGLNMAIEFYRQEVEQEEKREKPQPAKKARPQYYTPEKFTEHDGLDDIPF